MRVHIPRLLAQGGQKDVCDIEATADMLGHPSARTAWESLERTMSAGMWSEPTDI